MPSNTLTPSAPKSFRRGVSAFEEERVRDALAKFGGNRTYTAQELDVSLTTLLRWLRDNPRLSDEYPSQIQRPRVGNRRKLQRAV